MSDLPFANVRLSPGGGSVIIIDQTLLPGETRYLELRTPAELREAIASLRVRGAPAIGIFAAYALYVLARQSEALDFDGFKSELSKHSFLLNSARPTAVNLSAQLARMNRLVGGMKGCSVPQILGAMRDEAVKIQSEDADMCLKISEFGLTLMRDGFSTLTYCNAGPLAASLYGTGLGPILLAQERGMNPRAYCCETRPLLQGARLTMYELMKAGIDCTLICDNMASAVMKDRRVDAVFVGCDRVARNGDTANKIGTSGTAVLARHYGIPFYVFCPSSTIDTSCETGGDIRIELRAPDEIKALHFARQIAPDGAKCYNPAFDVTDGGLITAIITEKGIMTAPYDFK